MQRSSSLTAAMLRLMLMIAPCRLLAPPGLGAQQPGAPPAAPIAAPIERRDPVLDLAANEIGRALFLRCLCAEDNLSFDAQGHPATPGKTVDWTLAAVNVQKVSRKGPNQIELEGLRVAVRFAPDRREFDRHAQAEEHMKMILVDTGDPAAFERTLRAVFALGIDRALQRSLPAYWQHYFDPGLPWPPDSLTGVQIATFANPNPNAKPAEAIHKADAGFTLPASRDHVAGTIRLRLVIDTQGLPQHVAIAQPLGYGLDERAVEAIEKFRFTPATLNGSPVATNVLVGQDFVVAPAGR